MLCGAGLRTHPSNTDTKRVRLVYHAQTKTQPQNPTCKYDPGGHICTSYKITNLDTIASTQMILMDLDMTRLPKSYGNGFQNDASTTRKYGKRLHR